MRHLLARGAGPAAVGGRPSGFVAAARRPPVARMAAAAGAPRVQPFRALQRVLAVIVGWLAAAAQWLLPAPALPVCGVRCPLLTRGVRLCQGAAVRDFAPPDPAFVYYGYRHSPFYSALPKPGEAEVVAAEGEFASVMGIEGPIRWLHLTEDLPVIPYRAMDEARVRVVRGMHAEVIAKGSKPSLKAPKGGSESPWDRLFNRGAD